MLKIDELRVTGWDAALRGMRNPKNSWDRSDTVWGEFSGSEEDGDACVTLYETPVIGENDLKLASTLADAGQVHGKFLRMIVVTMDITAPLYWWKEFDTYKVGTVANSCSTMHKIHAKPFERADFSHDHLTQYNWGWLDQTIDRLNHERDKFNLSEGKDKEAWWQMIQMLPSSYNQKRTVMLNYAVLKYIYEYRRAHKVSEWHDFCDMIEFLPYAKELIIGRKRDAEKSVQ